MSPRDLMPGSEYEIVTMKKALEEFVNDKVTRIKTGLYTWRGRWYEVLRWETVKKRKNWSQYMVQIYKGESYYIRELTEETRKKYYGKTR